MKAYKTAFFTALSTLIVALVTLLSACATDDFESDAMGAFETQEITISAEVSGRLLLAHWQEGQLVDSGQVLGLIDTLQLHLQIEQLKARRSSTAMRQQDIGKQMAALDEQTATLLKERKRLKTLIDAKAANQKQLDDTDAQLSLISKQKAAQMSTLERGNAGLTQEEKAMEFQIASLDDQLRRCHLYAPMSGTVLISFAEPGEFVGVGRPVFKIADLRTMFLRVYLTAEQLPSIKLNDLVRVLLQGEKTSQERVGRVQWISSQAEFTPKTIQTRNERSNLVYAVKIAVPNDDGRIRMGMYGEISLAKIK